MGAKIQQNSASVNYPLNIKCMWLGTCLKDVRHVPVAHRFNPAFTASTLFPVKGLCNSTLARLLFNTTQAILN